MGDAVSCRDCGILNLHLRSAKCSWCGASLLLENAIAALLTLSPGRMLVFFLWFAEYFVSRKAIRKLGI